MDGILYSNASVTWINNFFAFADHPFDALNLLLFSKEERELPMMYYSGGYKVDGM